MLCSSYASSSVVLAHRELQPRCPPDNELEVAGLGHRAGKEIAALFLQQDLVGRGAGPASWAHVALERSFSESAVPQRLPASVATQKQQPKASSGGFGDLWLQLKRIKCGTGLMGQT